VLVRPQPRLLMPTVCTARRNPRTLLCPEWERQAGSAQREQPEWQLSPAPDDDAAAAAVSERPQGPLRELLQLLRAAALPAASDSNDSGTALTATAPAPSSSSSSSSQPGGSQGAAAPPPAAPKIGTAAMLLGVGIASLEGRCGAPPGAEVGGLVGGSETALQVLSSSAAPQVAHQSCETCCGLVKTCFALSALNRPTRKHHGQL
jgi:hypothetical protein